jgi:hypothetical protein
MTCARLAAEITHPHLVGIVDASVVVIALGGQQLDIAESEATDLEVMKVRVGPAHGGLQDVMQLGERGLNRHDEASPNGRLDAIQRHTDLDGVRLLPDRVLRGSGLR